MTYSIIDIIKNGKPGEVYRELSGREVENIVYDNMNYLVYEDSGLCFTGVAIHDAIRQNWQFESVEERVKDIILGALPFPIDISYVLRELQPYLKEEV